MRDYIWRIINRVQRSELMPKAWRTVILRAVGMDIPAELRIPGSSFGSRRVTIGQRSWINGGMFYDGVAPLTIGDDTAIGSLVRIVTGTHPIVPTGPRRRQRTSDHNISAPVTIGSGCWICTGVTILPGVTIAPGCVVAAGAVVTRSTEPNGFYAGVPARRLRSYPDA